MAAGGPYGSCGIPARKRLEPDREYPCGGRRHGRVARRCDASGPDARVAADGRVSAKLVDREQRAAHGLAWFATYVEALRQLAAYAERMSEAGRFGELEELLVRIGFGEYLAQMLGGIPMSQGEMVRPADLGLSLEAGRRTRVDAGGRGR